MFHRKRTPPASIPCPVCGAALTLQAVDSKGKSFRSTVHRQAVAVAQPAPPQRAPDVVSVRMRQAGVFGLMIATGVAILPADLPFAVKAGASATVLLFSASTLLGPDILKLAIRWLERRWQLDLNRDGYVPLPVETPAPEQVVAPIPYRAPSAKQATLQVEPKARRIVLRPSERLITIGRLTNYLWHAFENKWTRDGGVAWGLSQPEWADIRQFVQGWDDVWGTADSPTLEGFMSSLWETVTN